MLNRNLKSQLLEIKVYYKQGIVVQWEHTKRGLPEIKVQWNTRKEVLLEMKVGWKTHSGAGIVDGCLREPIFIVNKSVHRFSAFRIFVTNWNCCPFIPLQPLRESQPLTCSNSE
jgi:hypothetical protein